MKSVLPTPIGDSKLAAAFEKEQVTSRHQHCRMFAWIFVTQWLVTIGIAITLAPYTWNAAEKAIHPHVLAAIFLGAIISSLPTYYCWKYPKRSISPIIVSIAMPLMTTLLIHVTYGRIETHFHAFVSLAVLAFFRDQKLLTIAASIIFADHLIRGIFWPESVFGTEIAEPMLRAIEHGCWVLLELFFLSLAIGRSRSEMLNLIKHQLEVERLGQNLERKVEQRTRQLKESESKSRSMFENALVGLFRCADDGTVVSVNPAIYQMLGYDDAEDMLLAVPSIEKISSIPFVETNLKENGIIDRETKWKTKTGKKLSVKLSSKPIFDDEDQLIYIEGSVEDISDNRALEAKIRKRTKSLEEAKEALEQERSSLAIRVDERTAELMEANDRLTETARMKDAFLANMSHELRTPLNSILGLSEAFEEGIYGDLTDKQLQRIKSMETSGRHLLELINEVLDVAKLGAGEMKIDLEKIEIVPFTDACLAFIRVQANRKGIDVSCEIECNKDSFIGDQKRLKQVLINLLSNALKFTEKGSIKLIVSSAPESDKIQFQVVDTGIGISRDDQEKLFMPFVQLDSSLTREHNGTGLGLALVRQIVDLHGGDVRVESNEGDGSTFIVSIPKQYDLSESPLLCAESLAEINGDIQTAFVIEDSEIAAEQIARYLEEKDIQCSICESGEDALSQMEDELPDLVILDIQLPGMWGWDVLKTLKSNDRTSQIPVIIVSIEDDKSRGLKEGASGYLVKPVTRGEMNHALDKISTKNNSQPLHMALVATLSDSDHRDPRIGNRNANVPHILVAEDNEANIQVVSDFLEAKGYHLSIARDGLEAIEFCEQQLPDLVLMDVQMPKLDGLEATARLREDDRFKDLPIIAVTALAMRGDAEKCIEAGADDYLSKPLQLKSLDKKINALLENKTEFLPS